MSRPPRATPTSINSLETALINLASAVDGDGKLIRLLPGTPSVAALREQINTLGGWFGPNAVWLQPGGERAALRNMQLLCAALDHMLTTPNDIH